MLEPRFFVTLVLIFAIAYGAAWATRENDLASPQALIQEGNGKLEELKAMDKALSARAAWNLSTRSLEERRALKEDLAHYLSVLNRVLEIGSKRLLFFEDRGEILLKRDRAELQQKAIESFERQNGETYAPKRMVANGPSKKVY